jgi:ammonia channel protein AmtB
MKVLLLSSLFYLIGIALILYIKPNLMFHENGNWKEFGIDQDAKHTWFPFWLFCIVWAFISYGLSSFTYHLTGSTSSNSTDETSNVVELNSKAKKNSKNTMKSGYYVLDKEAYDNNGIPKYIFLGSDAPNQNE